MMRQVNLPGIPSNISFSLVSDLSLPLSISGSCTFSTYQCSIGMFIWHRNNIKQGRKRLRSRALSPTFSSASNFNVAYIVF